LKAGSSFTGIGSWEKALDDLGIEYDLKFFSEIDKYAIKSYCAIHNVDESLNIGDITKIKGDEVEDIDLFVYSPPCQAFSLAGNQQGFDDKRGVLFFDSLRIIENKKPKYALMENVKNLTGKKFKGEFESMLKALEDIGYNNYWKVLNSKDYGIPQNRERVFIVSIRKDIDDNKFIFPEKQNLELRLKDMLEDEVDEKFYIRTDKIEKLIENFKNKEICNTIRTGGRGSLDIKHSWDIICEQRSDEGLRFFKDNICGSLRTIDSCGDKRVLEEDYRIRKLTPLECWRLQGFKDEDFYKAQGEGMSNSQLYKMAGNSITVNVPKEIFKNLFKL